jgi:ABC-type lipoprotein release transport system permease subunit
MIRQKMFFKLAWRNIWRNKRRSVLTLAAIVFATTISIAMRGLQIGTYAVNIKYVANLFSGYLQIQKKGFQETNSLTKSFRLSDSLKKVLNSRSEILGYAPRISGGGLISYKSNSYGAVLFGISPEAEIKTSTLMNRIKKGKFFASSHSGEIVLGYKLLENLHAEIGDTVVVLAQGYDGSLGNLKFRIVGSAIFGNPQLDASAVFMGLADADELLAMYGRINMVAIKLASLEDIPDVREYLQKNIPDKNLVVLDWSQILPDVKQSIELDNIGGILDLAILIIIVAFGILNTFLISVTERFKEFGISLSIGMPQGKLVFLVVLEALLLSAVGILIGNIFAYGINWYLVENPIHFGSELQKLYEIYGFLPVMVSSLKPSVFINSSVVILIASLVAGIYPAYKVYKLEPLKGIRYT